MRTRRPPRFATLLLNRLSDNQALAGDLDEAFYAGKSAAWYWRQVLVAVGLSTLREIDLYDLFAAQGALMQFVMLGLISVCVVFTMKMVLVFSDHMPRVLLPFGVRHLFQIGLSFFVAAFVGTAVARVHLQHRIGAILTFSASVTLWTLGNLYVFDGKGNLDSTLPYVLVVLVFISGLLTGGLLNHPHVRHS